MQPNYAPQQVPAPNGYAQPQYTPQPQYGQQQPGMPPTAANGTAQAFQGMAVPVMYDAPAPGSGDFKRTPHVRNLVGRVVGLVPTGYTPDKWPADPNKPGDKPKDQVTFTAHIFEPGEILFGEEGRIGGKPATHKITGPTWIAGCVSSNQEILRALADKINLQTPNVMVGVVEYGKASDPKNNPPLRVAPLAPDDPRRAMIGQYWQAYAQGQIPEAVPVELNPQPQGQSAAVPQQQYAQPAQYGQQPYSPQQQFQAPTQQQYAPAAAPGPQAPPPGAQVHYGPQPTQQQQPGSVDPSQAPPPPGWEAMWPGMSPEQKAKILGS